MRPLDDELRARCATARGSRPPPTRGRRRPPRPVAAPQPPGLRRRERRPARRGRRRRRARRHQRDRDRCRAGGAPEPGATAQHAGVGPGRPGRGLALGLPGHRQRPCRLRARGPGRLGAGAPRQHGHAAVRRVFEPWRSRRSSSWPAVPTGSAGGSRSAPRKAGPVRHGLPSPRTGTCPRARPPSC